MPVHIGDKAPNLIVSEWLQVKPTNLDRERNLFPFPVSMDGLMRESPLTDTKLMVFIEANLTDFTSYSETENRSIFEQAEAKQSIESKQFSAKTFEVYSLRIAQSAILVDRNGVYPTHLFWFDRFSGERNKAVAE
jgi:hypothetical protein